MKIGNLAMLLLFCFSGFTFANEQLTGDKRTACEVILCLSSGTRPSECNAPIRKYFSIQIFHHGSLSHSRTVKARKNFLKLCPTSSSEPKMESLVDVLSNMKNLSLCTANSLNSTIDKRLINNNYYYRTTTKLPDYCSVLSNHDYTDIKLPKYTCNKEFYSSEDWRKGYKLRRKNGIFVNKGGRNKNSIKNQDRIPIQKICWVD